MLSLYGWTTNPGSALQFRTKDDALRHAADEGLIGALALFLPEPKTPGVDGDASRIFGYPMVRQHHE